MILHQVFAQICEGEVKNVAVFNNYEEANYISRATYGDAAFAVDCLLYPCQIGDEYKDNIFYHSGEDGTLTIINPVPTQEQQVAQLSNDMDNTYVALADLIGGVYSA